VRFAIPEQGQRDKALLKRRARTASNIGKLVRLGYSMLAATGSAFLIPALSTAAPSSWVAANLPAFSRGSNH
jgi:hypothetical protein